MAARLPLILSQPARRDATATELIENIVAAALLMPKLDANLIGDISTIEAGSTDHLCLQGLTRDVILASFLDMGAAQSQWQRLGQTGQFVDCAQSPEGIRGQATAAGQRRVFYFQLNYSLKVARLLDQCHELVAAQAVQLVSIQLGGKSQATANALPIIGVVQPPSNQQPGPTNGHAHNHNHNHHHGQVPATPSSSSNSRPQPQVDETEVDQDWSGIDKLVDELDALDI